MRYLCKLVTPPGGIVLDMFAGSGTTGASAVLEAFRFVGIEGEALCGGLGKKRLPYVELARGRIAHAIGGNYDAPPDASAEPAGQMSMF